MKLNSSIFVAGHKGLVGSAIVRKLKSYGYSNIYVVQRSELDLSNQAAVNEWFRINSPRYVIDAAAKVGGILRNKTHKADMIYQNIMIQTNLIDAAYHNNCEKFLFLGSSCIYPKESNIPIKEDQLMGGQLETTNDSYAIAKIAGIYMCKSYLKQYGFNAISALPCSLYGPGDNYDLNNSHVLPALIRKCHEGKVNTKIKNKLRNIPTIELWGDGSPLREFLYVDDLAAACIFLMLEYSGEEHINIGSGNEISIKDLAKLTSEIVGYKGNFNWDRSKPNGALRKLLDSSKIKYLGWESKVTLTDGIKNSYEDFKKRYD